MSTKWFPDCDQNNDANRYIKHPQQLGNKSKGGNEGAQVAPQMLGNAAQWGRNKEFSYLHFVSFLSKC